MQIDQSAVDKGGSSSFGLNMERFSCCVGYCGSFLAAVRLFWLSHCRSLFLRAAAIVCGVASCLILWRSTFLYLFQKRELAESIYLQRNVDGVRLAFSHGFDDGGPAEFESYCGAGCFFFVSFVHVHLHVLDTLPDKHRLGIQAAGLFGFSVV